MELHNDTFNIIVIAYMNRIFVLLLSITYFGNKEHYEKKYSYIYILMNRKGVSCSSGGLVHFEMI